MPTLVSYRREGAILGGRYYQATVKSSGATTTTFIVDSMVSSTSSDDLIRDYWVYLPAASANDKVRLATFAASTGTTTVDRAYSGATVPQSKVVEFHGLCAPFSDDLTQYDWTRAINDTLKQLWLTVEFTITPTVNQVRHSLATQTWITNDAQVLDVGVLTTGETRNNTDPYQYRPVYGEIEQDGGTLYLNHSPRTFATNETIYVRAAKRAYEHCRASGGSYGDQSGLALESDEAPVPLDVVSWGALVQVAQNLRNDLSDAGQEHVKARQAEWAANWKSAIVDFHKRLPSRRFRRKVAFHAGGWGGR